MICWPGLGYRIWTRSPSLKSKVGRRGGFGSGEGEALRWREAEVCAIRRGREAEGGGGDRGVEESNAATARARRARGQVDEKLQ